MLDKRMTDHEALIEALNAGRRINAEKNDLMETVANLLGLR
jgi:hypothetical protein